MSGLVGRILKGCVSEKDIENGMSGCASGKGIGDVSCERY